MVEALRPEAEIKRAWALVLVALVPRSGAPVMPSVARSTMLPEVKEVMAWVAAFISKSR